MEALQSELEEELRMLTVKELRMRAAAEGVDEDAIEDARDSDTPKESLIELILAMSVPMAPEATTWPDEPNTAAMEPLAEEVRAALGTAVLGAAGLVRFH